MEDGQITGFFEAKYQRSVFQEEAVHQIQKNRCSQRKESHEDELFGVLDGIPPEEIDEGAERKEKEREVH